MLKKHEKVIKIILQDLFSSVLSGNEIKTASLPYYDIIFNSSRRFEEIIQNAGDDFQLIVRGVPEELSYIMECTVILNFYYGFKLDFKRPLFYDIPDEKGVMKHYRILYNADFLELTPTGNAKELTQDDIDELLENFDNVEIWKEKIPPNSFVSKGFVISNIFDATTEHSISEIKSSLIANDKRAGENFVDNLQETFKSFFGVPDIHVGFVAYNTKDDRFERVYGNNMRSFILQDEDMKPCEKVLCEMSYIKLLKKNDYFAIGDVDKYNKMSGGMPLYKSLKEQNIKSAIFAPIASNGSLMGVLELVSTQINVLNSVNAQKLNDIMPYIVSAVIRSAAEEENLIDAIIQHECTTVHSSVYWKFQEEAKHFIKNDLEGKSPCFNEIVFKDVYPLYGQIDIKDSSVARNNAIQKDLMIQLATISEIISEAWNETKLPVYEELLFRIKNHIDDVKEVLSTNSEQAVFDFVKDEVSPVLAYLKSNDANLNILINTYEKGLDSSTASYYMIIEKITMKV